MNGPRGTTENLKAGKRRYYNSGQKDYATFLETSKETGGDTSGNLLLLEVYRPAGRRA